MNRQPIEYLQWFVFVLCHVFLYFYNKEFAYIFWLPHPTSNHTQLNYPQISTHIHTNNKPYYTSTTPYSPSYYLLHKLTTLSLNLTIWSLYRTAQYTHNAYRHTYLHKIRKHQHHKTQASQHPQTTYHLNKIIAISLTLTLWLSLRYTTTQIPQLSHIINVPLNQAQNIKSQCITITNIIHHIVHTHHKATHPHTHPLTTTLKTTFPHYNHAQDLQQPTQHTPQPNPPPIPPIQPTIHISNILYITHTHLKTPKAKLIKYYIWNNTTLITLSGDIETNPGPLTNILTHLPLEYQKRQKQYFIPNTLELKPQYTHLEREFEPYLSQKDSSHQNHDLTHLRNHSTLLAKYPTSHQRYALIIAYSPIPQKCNLQMAKRLDPRCLTILRRLQEITLNGHPNPTQETHHHLATTTATIPQTYSLINDKIAKGLPITPEGLQNELPHLPYRIIQELTKCTQNIKGYHPTPTITHTYITPQTYASPNRPPTQTLQIITWNTGCINSSLPGIQDLTHTLHNNPHIILIQETKLPKTKSTTYIDRLLPDYKIIYNNSNNTTQRYNQYNGPSQTRGGVLAMLPKSIYTNENIVKVLTTSTISPYLQIIIIKNTPLTPITILNIYMPSHLEDTHLIPEIQDQIHKIILQHPNHTTILAGDFNRDILLQGRTNNGITTPPNLADQEWASFTHNNGLQAIKNPIGFTRQGGHNYTSTSHIDGFYTNTPNAANLQSQTLTNLNQNSDHYPVMLQLDPNTVVIKETTTPTNTPRITYPIPPNNLQNLQTIFLDKQNLAIENLTQILQQDHLTTIQWEDAQHKFQEITNSLSQCIEQTCMAPPTPPLPNRVKSQGGFLPRTQQKKMETTTENIPPHPEGHKIRMPKPPRSPPQ